MLAKLFRSLRVDAIVGPLQLQLFSSAVAEATYQRPDALLRNPRGLRWETGDFRRGCYCS